MKVKKVENNVYEFLLEQIQSGYLSPGAKIVEEEVAKQLGVSRSPVRNAIKRLGHKGLLKQVPYKGAFVLKPVISKKNYLEKVQMFELLLIQHLFQIESKKLSLPFSDMHACLLKLEQAESAKQEEQLNQLQVELVKLLMSRQTNAYYRHLVFDQLETILKVADSHLGISQLTINQLFREHFKLLTNFLAEKGYAKGRREIRIFINALTLAVIDQEDLGRINKYEM